jgi:hypothetical protein
LGGSSGRGFSFSHLARTMKKFADGFVGAWYTAHAVLELQSGIVVEYEPTYGVAALDDPLVALRPSWCIDYRPERAMVLPSLLAWTMGDR